MSWKLFLAMTCVSSLCRAAGEVPNEPANSTDLYRLLSVPVGRLQNAFRQKVVPTLWCGIRDVAPAMNAISSIYPHVDSCCREHDHCPLIIDRGQCFEDICNPSVLFPILLCKCEVTFQRCLKSLPSERTLPFFRVSAAERTLSDMIEVGYFQVLPQFFERKCLQKSPQKTCVERGQTKDGLSICLRQEISRDLPHTWQLFDINKLDSSSLFLSSTNLTNPDSLSNP